MKSDLIHAVIDSSHSFWKYLKNPCAFFKWQGTSLEEQAAYKHSRFMTTLLSLSFTVFGMSASVLMLAFCWGHRTSYEFVSFIKLYKSFLHEWFPHFLCLRHLASLDDILHVAKFVRSVRRDLCIVKGVSMNLNYFTTE